MRSPREIAFRLRAEAANLWLWLRPPALSLARPPLPLPLLPDPDLVCRRLAGAPFAAEVVRLAEEVLQHRIPLLGITLDAGPQIRWRDDAIHGVSNPGTPYFRRVPYLDFARSGDHKIIWELNRHQHLVLLAQAWRFTGRAEFVAEIGRQIDSWIAANPFQCGINWASALEVAFRAMSWMWVLHLAGPALPAPLLERLVTGLYQHGCHLEHNLSIYFSPNTHLLGEAVALHALGALFPSFPRAARWRDLGGRLVLEQLHRQVRPDGSHFEQSSYYHLYALDMFLFHQAIANPGPDYRATLDRMGRFLAALAGPSRSLPLIGDDDGGRWFHPYGPREAFAGASESVWFPDAGIGVMQSGDLHVLIDAGPFGPASAGHSHSDTLSLVVSCGGEEILIDPGTYTYVEPRWRDWFRGSAAHNTIRIDGADQAIPAHPFRWEEKPEVALRRWIATAEFDFLDASCRYRGFTHRRRVLLMHATRSLLVLDDVDGPPGQHRLEQFWHLGSAAARRCLILPDAEAPEESQGGEHGWRSLALGHKEPAPVVRLERRCALPARFVAALDAAGAGGPLTLEGDTVRLGPLRVHFGDLPVLTFVDPASECR